MVKEIADNFLASGQKPPRHHHAFRAPPAALHLAAILSLLSAPLLFTGCNDNTTTAAGPTSVLAPPPVIHATALPGGPAALDAAWQNATWTPFLPPLNSRSSTPPTRAALLYDASNLYVSVVAQRSAVVSSDLQDKISIFLDPHADGIEVLDITLDLTSDKPVPRYTWFRRSTLARPAENVGTAAPTSTTDPALPADRFPDIKLTGIRCEVRDSLDGELPARTAFITIPIGSLPGPLQAAPGGAPFKLNIVRALSSTYADGRQNTDRQSNLSPILLGSHSPSHARMADLQFVK